MPNLNFDADTIWLFWLALAVIFFLIELFTPTFITVFFAAGALIAGGAALLEFSITSQVITFVIASITLLILLRKKMPKIFSQNTEQNKAEEDTSVNANATVVEAISSTAAGRIKYQGTFWNAESTEEIPSGAVVRIISRKDSDPNTFIVTKD